MKKFKDKNKYIVGSSEHNECDGTEKKTVPNQAYKVRDLVEMHKRGIDPAIMKKALYEEEFFGDELNPFRAKNFDLSDIDKIQAELKHAQQAIEAKQKKESAERKKLEREQIARQWIQEKIDSGEFTPKDVPPIE